MSWLCDQLKGKNKRVAYKECRAVLLGDYYDGTTIRGQRAEGSWLLR
jgi:hypothetical protein